MKPKTAIALVLLAGAGVAAWMYFRARQGVDNLGRIIPQESGFDYSSAMAPARSSTGKTILGTAVPRQTTTTTTRTGTTTAPIGNAAPAPTYSGTAGYTVPEFDGDPYMMEA